MALINVTERGRNSGKIESGRVEEKAAGEWKQSNINHKTNVDWQKGKKPVSFHHLGLNKTSFCQAAECAMRTERLLLIDWLTPHCWNAHAQDEACGELTGWEGLKLYSMNVVRGASFGCSFVLWKQSVCGLCRANLTVNVSLNTTKKSCYIWLNYIWENKENFLS